MDETTPPTQVTPNPLAGERTEQAKTILEEILTRLGVSAAVDAREVGDEIVLRVQVGEGAEAVGLQGPRAALWEPIGYLVSKMVGRDPSRRCFVAIETGAPGEAQAPTTETDEDLLALGRFLAERAKRLGRVLAVGPMGSKERRVIHLAVKEVAGVSSRSEGEGGARRLLIVPDVPAPVIPPVPQG